MKITQELSFYTKDYTSLIKYKGLYYGITIEDLSKRNKECCTYNELLILSENNKPLHEIIRDIDNIEVNKTNDYFDILSFCSKFKLDDEMFMILDRIDKSDLNFKITIFIYDYIERNHVKMIQYLIDRGVFINQHKYFVHAIKHNKLNVVKILLPYMNEREILDSFEYSYKNNLKDILVLFLKKNYMLIFENEEKNDVYLSTEYNSLFETYRKKYKTKKLINERRLIKS